MKWLHMVAFLLMVVGAVTWGTVALFQFNVVDMVLVQVHNLDRLVYVLVGASVSICWQLTKTTANLLKVRL